MENKETVGSFNRWNKQKKMLHLRNRMPDIKTGEIWWCGTGQNVGVEINGKGRAFARPIIIYKILGRSSFMGIPLTSKNKSGDWYVKFRHRGRLECAALCQARVTSRARLYERMGEMDDEDFERVSRGFRHLYSRPKNVPNSRLGWCGRIPKIYKLIISKFACFVKKFSL